MKSNIPVPSDEIERFIIEVPQNRPLVGMRTVTASNYIYTELQKGAGWGMQTHTTYEPYNKQLGELNRTLLNKAEDIAEYYRSTKFIVPQDSLFPTNQFDEVKLSYEVERVLRVLLLGTMNIDFHTYKDLIDHIKYVGIPYHTLKHISESLRTLKIKLDLFKHLNEP